MSHTFSISASVPPPCQDLLVALGLPDLRCVEGMPADESAVQMRAEATGVADELPPPGPWLERPLHFYRHGISTRGTEVSYKDAVFQVRVMTLAAPEDWDLALRLVEKAAAVLQSPIDSEGFGEMPASELRHVHNEAWVNGQLESGTRALVYLVTEDDGVVQTPGPVRTFYLGPRLLRELQAAGPPEALPQRMLQAIRRVQYVDPEEYDPAGVFESAARGGDGERPSTFAVWGPGKNYLFPAVDHLLVDADGKQTELFLVPYQALPEIAGERWSWLDEKQTLVKACPDAEWPSLVRRARRQAEGLAGKRKKWWQFWKS